MADDQIAFPRDEAISVAVPSIRAFVRFQIVHGPEAADPSTARATEESGELQQAIEGEGGALRARDRRELAAPPEPFGPMQVHSVEVPGTSVHPFQIDLEIIRHCNPVFRERRVTQREVRIALLRDPWWKSGDAIGSLARLSSVRRHEAAEVQIRRRRRAQDSTDSTMRVDVQEPGSEFAEANRSGRLFCSRTPGCMNTDSMYHVSPASPDVPSPPEAEDAGWLTAPEEERSIRGDLREIFRDELWRYRGLAYELMRRDLRVRYKQTALGFAWAVLMPTLVVLAGATVRYAMSYIGGRPLGIQDLAGIAIKAVPWSFFVGSLGMATTSLVGQGNLVSKIYFPREVLPLASTLAQGFDACVGILTLVVAFLLLGVDVGAAALWAPALLLLVFVLTAGLGLLVSCANLFFRDVKYVVQVLLTFGIFFTPVFFEPEMFGPAGARVMMLNPLAPLMEGLRLSVVFDRNLLDTIVVQGRHGTVLAWSPWYLAYSAAWAIAAFVGGLLLFHRAESKFAEYV